MLIQAMEGTSSGESSTKKAKSFLILPQQAMNEILVIFQDGQSLRPKKCTSMMMIRRQKKLQAQLAISELFFFVEKSTKKYYDKLSEDIRSFVGRGWSQLSFYHASIIIYD